MPLSWRVHLEHLWFCQFSLSLNWLEWSELNYNVNAVSREKIISQLLRNDGFGRFNMCVLKGKFDQSFEWHSYVAPLKLINSKISRNESIWKILAFFLYVICLYFTLHIAWLAEQDLFFSRPIYITFFTSLLSLVLLLNSFCCSENARMKAMNNLFSSCCRQWT